MTRGRRSVRQASLRPVRGAAARLVLGVAALVLLAAPASATTYLQLSPQAMLAKASMVFVGTVEDTSVANQGGTPWTHVRFKVDTALKGVSANAKGQAQQPVTLAFLGGSVPGGPALTVSGMPSFRVGEKVLLFAYNQAYASPIVGFRQGLWRVTAAGLRDEDGALLSVDSQGRLVRGGAGAPLSSIVAAIRASLGSNGSAP